MKCGRPRLGFHYEKALVVRENGSTLRQTTKAIVVSDTTIYRGIGRA